MAESAHAEGMHSKFGKAANNPGPGRFKGFHSMNFYVQNAKQAADFYVTRFGFRRVAYKGLETNSRQECTQVIQQGKIIFTFTCLLNPETTDHPICAWLATRGDSVCDVSFRCTDVEGIWKKAVERGCKGVKEPQELSDDNGSVLLASLETYGGVTHTLIDDSKYNGVFLPGFKAVSIDDASQAKDYDPLFVKLQKTHPVGLEFLDHCVGNQPDKQMLPACQWYNDYLDFHRFWSVDDKQVHTEFSSLRSVVMADWHETIKMPINEPAKGMRKSQIQEYCEYHGGAGVQHIALNTPDIIKAVRDLRARGMKFLDIAPKYYDNLRERLKTSSIQLEEDIDILQELNILIDMDDTGYLLQIFTKPVEDRPTLFIEIIQRHGNQGFGVGNFKALFQSIEREQERRGNFVADNAKAAAKQAKATQSCANVTVKKLGTKYTKPVSKPAASKSCSSAANSSTTQLLLTGAMMFVTGMFVAQRMK